MKEILFRNGFYHFYLSKLALMHRAEFIFLHLQSIFISQLLSFNVISIDICAVSVDDTCTAYQRMVLRYYGMKPWLNGTGQLVILLFLINELALSVDPIPTSPPQ